MKLLELKNISFSYNKNTNLFSSISTFIDKGDFIGIFGENGSGKTTLIKIILGIIKANSGSINWFDENEKISNKNCYNIEYISQKASVLDSIIPITVKEIVKMGNKAKKSFVSHFKNSCSYENIENALKHVKMIDFINIPFSELSGGQKQRVLIAKALISNPDIIIMDEPTIGIDLIGQKHFYELLDHLNKFHKITIIIISHDTNFIQEKIKRIWYVGNNDCLECLNKKTHLINIENMFPNQKVEIFS